MNPSESVLSSEQLEQFVSEGYTVLRGAFARDEAIAWVQSEAAAAGIDIDDQSTWTKDYLRISTKRVECHVARYLAQSFAN